WLVAAVAELRALGRTTRMELVTRQDESERLEREMPIPVPVFDVILDDGSLVPSVVAVGDRAFGIIVGGHSGFFSFAAVPELATRQVRATLRLTRIHSLPFIGQRLRRLWAESIGASLTRPSWIPTI